MMGVLAGWEGEAGSASDPVCAAAMFALASLGRSWVQAGRPATTPNA